VTPAQATTLLGAIQAWMGGTVRAPATHYHRHWGRFYRVLHEAAVNATTGHISVIYQSENGFVYSIPQPEFYDGQFIPVADIFKDTAP
jgi:hypothetical protein